MNISHSRFEEILSAYLDGEASQDELNLLSECVKNDKKMSDIFHKECQLHLATCAIYGKKVKFLPLNELACPFVIRKRVSKSRRIFEWTLVASFMVTSVTLSYVCLENISDNDVSIANNYVVDPNSALALMPDSVVTSECIFENGRLYSLIKFTGEKPLVVLANK